MADLKISALPASTTPLAGTEVLPIVQSTSTKQVSVTNLTSGRTVDMSIGLVNTTTARANVLGSITNSFQVEGTAGNNSSGQMVRNSANANGPSLYLGKSRSATVNGNTVVVSGDTLGRIDWIGADGTNLVRAASIYVTVDGTPGTNDMPGRLALLTSPDGTVSPVERLTIDNTGVVTVSSENLSFNTAGKGLLFTGNGSVIWRCGANTPEGAVTAPVGSLFTRTDGGANTTLYVKESGTGNTGWVAK
jgi:hypothetical protein